MTALERRYPIEEHARRGDEIYDRDVEPRLTPEQIGKSVLIDIETGDWEIDSDEVAASDRLLAKHPQAQIWTRQAGSLYARVFGLGARGAGR